MTGSKKQFSIPARQHGFPHILAATKYSVGGAGRLLGETAFRHECILFLIILLSFGMGGAGLGNYLVAASLFFMLAAAEAMNTAIEIIVDQISPNWSAPARDAKDLGSFAVLCLLAANAAYAIYVIAGLFWQGIQF